MAARVEVVQGPDAGWRFTVWAGEVRIGRGAGHQIKLSDPAIGDGHLRVQFRSGGYLVTNRMPHPIFLDGQLLNPGEQRTWYAGSGLQPTAATLLRLEAVEVAGAEVAGGVKVEPPGTGPQKKKRKSPWEYVALGVVVLGLAVLGGRHVTKPKPTTPAAVFSTEVAPKLTDAARSGPAARHVEAAHRAVQLAVFRQSEGNLAEAKQCYLEARDVIVAARQAVDANRHPAAAVAIDLAGVFVGQQLQGM